jgi:hypothetical protein
MCVGGAEPDPHPFAEEPEVFFGRLASALVGWNNLKKTFNTDVILANFNELLEAASRVAHEKDEVSKAAKENPKPPKAFHFTPATWIDPHFVDPLMIFAIMMGSYATVYGWKFPPPSVSHVTRDTMKPECGVIDYVFREGLPQLFGHDVPIAE